MNNISLQSNTQMAKNTALCGWGIAHDAMSDHGAQLQFEVLCAYATAIERPKCSMV